MKQLTGYSVIIVTTNNFVFNNETVKRFYCNHFDIKKSLFSVMEKLTSYKVIILATDRFSLD